MPVGLCKASAPFHRLMDGIFPNEIGIDLAPYLDVLLL